MLYISKRFARTLAVIMVQWVHQSGLHDAGASGQDHDVI